MKVLVTGATGLLGANLAQLLHKRGLRPKVLVREQSDRRGLRGVPHDEVLGDVLDPESLRRAMEGVTHVFHCAGAVRFDPFNRHTLHRLHVQGTRHVVEAARAAGVQRLVHTSSVAAVGRGTLVDPATEETDYNFPGDNPYHASKRDAEQMALLANGLDFEVVVGNPSYVVGAYDVRPSSGELLIYVARGWVRAYPSGGTNFVNAEDAAQGLWLLMEQGKPGERYILGGENLTFRQFLTLSAEEAGVRPPLFPLPDRLLETAGRVGSMVGWLAPQVFRFLNEPFLRALYLPSYQSSGKAIRELGYHPRPIRLGVREALRWFQEEGMIARDHPLTPRDPRSP